MHATDTLQSNFGVHARFISIVTNYPTSACETLLLVMTQCAGLSAPDRPSPHALPSDGPEALPPKVPLFLADLVESSECLAYLHLCGNHVAMDAKVIPYAIP